MRRQAADIRHWAWASSNPGTELPGVGVCAAMPRRILTTPMAAWRRHPRRALHLRRQSRVAGIPVEVAGPFADPKQGRSVSSSAALRKNRAVTGACIRW